MNLQRILMMCLALVVSACAHNARRAENPAYNPQALNENSSNTPAAVDDEAPRAQIRENEDNSEAVEEKAQTPYKSPLGEIALDYNKHVEKWVRYFQGKGRGHMERYLTRSGRYLPMMKNVLRENGLPEDLVYIALIESGFSPQAHSHANAVGYWQFIRATGKRYGLNVDPFIDERRDPVLATRAAAEYFKSLYSLFGSWHLSMAAYNVGENRVKRAVMKYYTRDFWQLISKRRSFPSETKNYVPKFIAAAMIAKDPVKYGFADIKYADPLSYDTISLQNPISLSRLADNLNVDKEELRLLNPKFRGDFVPISRGAETVVRIPVGMAADAAAAASISVTSEPKVIQADNFFYRIKRGDTLSTIARRHRTTVSQLRRLNNLSNRALLRLGQRLRVPDNGGAARYQLASEESSKVERTVVSTAPPLGEVDFHTVRRGDNLSTIARKYGVGLNDLMKLNNLSAKSKLRVGQRLRIKPIEASKSADTTSRSKRRSPTLAQFKSKSADKKVAKKVQSKASHLAASSASKTHTVRRGETLLTVSHKYGISLSKLARANGVSANYRVLAGESLSIP